MCVFLVSSSKVRRSLHCSVNTGKQEKKKATTNTQAARKWTQAGRLRLKDRVRGARCHVDDGDAVCEKEMRKCVRER